MKTGIQQLEIPFDELAAEDRRGEDELFTERERAIAELQRRFGLPLNTQVRVTIHGIPGEFFGKLTLDSLLFPEKAKDAIPMRLGRVTFDLRDIESCSRIEWWSEAYRNSLASRFFSAYMSLIEMLRKQPDFIEWLRSALSDLDAEDLTQITEIEKALHNEEQSERDRDREYRKPRRAELERLRHGKWVKSPLKQD